MERDKARNEKDSNDNGEIIMSYLPITKKEMDARGWKTIDIVLVTGDAYVDHPSFGTAIISRVLESRGYRVGIVSQPQSEEDIAVFGRPKLAFYVNGGNIDPMVAHYTVAKKRRSKDYYTPGGAMGRRPDRACTAYCQMIRSRFHDIPIAIGGLEASLRRFAHYDYWSNTVMPSILISSGADLLMFGMGEKQAVCIADRLGNNEKIGELRDIRGTVYVSDSEQCPILDCEICPSFEEVKMQTPEGFRFYASATAIQQNEQDAIRGKAIAQRHGNRWVVQNRPMPPLSVDELDAVYDLPYERNYHPSYESLGGVPAIEEVKFSIIHNRGCFGACNFCSIAYHQGRQIVCRSEKSILKEAEKIAAMPDFKGYIHDVGGPTANFRHPSCEKQESLGLCKGKKCLAPKPCPHLRVDHKEYLSLLRKIRAIPGVKKVFIRSGIRFDYLMLDRDETFLKELVAHHVSGQLKVAPEHCSDHVLNYMGKPDFSVYRKFQKRFYELTKSMNKKQYLVPYLMSSHPGSTLSDAIELALFLKKERLHPEQVQDFYPTPGTVSTCMYYTGLDPNSLKSVWVARSKEDKAKQRALLQYYRPENRRIIADALRSAHREDLIGFGNDCLISPDRTERTFAETARKSSASGERGKRKTSLTKHLKHKRK